MIGATERWLPVIGWEGLYEVSDHGRVRSLYREVVKSDGRVAHYVGRVLKPSPTRMGYFRVGLTDSSNDRAEIVMIHRLVAEAFIDGGWSGAHVLHWDDDKSNNRVSNLRWGTHADNMQDIVRNGNHHHAIKTHYPAGHAYAGANLYVLPSRPNARYCRACARENRAAHRERRKLASAA